MVGDHGQRDATAQGRRYGWTCARTSVLNSRARNAFSFNDATATDFQAKVTTRDTRGTATICSE